jgi:hypothetical protein
VIWLPSPPLQGAEPSHGSPCCQRHIVAASRKTRRAAAAEDYWPNGAHLDWEFESDGETLVIRRPGRW